MARRLINLRPGRMGAMYLRLLPFVILIALYVIGSSLPPRRESGRQAVARPFGDGRDGGALCLLARAALWRHPSVGRYRRQPAAPWPRAGGGNGLRAGGGRRRPMPYVRAGLSPLVAVVSMIPPMAILAILFVVGLDLKGQLSSSSVVQRSCVRQPAARIEEMPREQLIKAQTLGASTWQIVSWFCPRCCAPDEFVACRWARPGCS
jgi:NitT/TauT family transport system permease protein